MKYIRLLFFFCFVISLQAQELGKWNWQNPKPSGNTYNTVVSVNPVAATPAGIVAAFGEGGTMVRSTDAGATWSFSIIDSLSREIEDVDAVSPAVWFGVGDAGLVVKTTDGGASGITINTGYTDHFYSVDFINADTGYIGGATGRLIKTTDGGATWTALTSGVTTSIYALFALSADNVWFGSSSTSALKQSTDYGVTWTVKTPSGLTQSIWSIYFTDVLHGWVATQNSGKVYYTKDGGATWSNATAFASAVPNTVFFVDTLTGFVTNNNALGGNVFKTTDGGVTYTGTVLPPGIDFTYDVSGSAAAVYLVGRYGLIYKSTDLGATWTPLYTQVTTRSFREVKFVTEDIGYAVGGSTTTADSLGTIYKTTDAGNTWSLFYGDLRSMVYSLAMPSSTTWYAANYRNRVYKTTDGGATWTWLSTTSAISGTTTLNKIAFADSLIGFAVNNAGKIMKTINGGTSWDTVASPFGSSAIYDMRLFNANKVICVGNAAKAFMTTDGGTSWTAMTTNIPGNFFGVNFYNENYGIITGYNSAGPATVAAKTTDGGLTWTALTLPSNHTISCYAAVYEDTTTFWIIDQNGFTSRTTDGGLTWVQSTAISANGIFSIAKSGKYLHAVGSGGTILKCQWSTIIPVELSSFSASVVDGKVNLNWTTATETNNRGFEIHKQSGDGAWEVIGFVSGAGSTTEKHQYSFMDNEVLSVKASYRLRQIDFDGASQYSNVIELDPVNAMSFELTQNYPNPFNPTTKIFYQVANDMPVSIVLYDALGKEVKTLVSGNHSAGKYMIQLNAENLASGTYFYRMDAGAFSQTRKLILIK